MVKQRSFRGVKRFLTRLSPPFLKPARFALSTASELFHPKLLPKFLPKFLMGYCAGWGNRRNRDGTAPLVLDIHVWGMSVFPRQSPSSLIFSSINREADSTGTGLFMVTSNSRT